VKIPLKFNATLHELLAILEKVLKEDAKEKKEKHKAEKMSSEISTFEGWLTLMQNSIRFWHKHPEFLPSIHFLMRKKRSCNKESMTTWEDAILLIFQI